MLNSEKKQSIKWEILSSFNELKISTQVDYSKLKFQLT